MSSRVPRAAGGPGHGSTTMDSSRRIIVGSVLMLYRLRHDTARFASNQRREPQPAPLHVLSFPLAVTLQLAPDVAAGGVRRPRRHHGRHGTGHMPPS
eukprot:scaffold12586_cov132-Isochrysis_galbana.AAC.13